MKIFLAGALLASIPVPFGLRAQDSGFEVATKTKSCLVYAAEAQTIAAGKNELVEVRFRVQEGFHVNSHTPRTEYLIPTTLSVDPATGVKVAAPEYPAGTAYSFSFEPNEKLDVYTGAFKVKLPVVATKGEHTLAAALHYQACDHAACYPAKTLPVEVLFTAK